MKKAKNRERKGKIIYGQHEKIKNKEKRGENGMGDINRLKKRAGKEN